LEEKIRDLEIEEADVSASLRLLSGMSRA